MQRYKVFVLFAIAVSVITVSLITRDVNNSDDEPIISSAYWVSQARTVPDLVRESNLIVYARVKQTPVTRIVTQELPVLNEQGTPVATMTDSLPFSDTLFEVVKVYFGSAPAELLVMQTGGSISSGKTVEFPDDPLYQVGEVYILFLVDISDDALHASDRQLYRIVSPAGRFLVADGLATTYLAEGTDNLLPNTVNELERQILLSVPTIQEDK